MLSSSLIEYIDNNLDVSSDKLEIAYSIYLLLGKVLKYDPLFAHSKKNRDKFLIENVTLNNPYVICDTWALIYKLFLDRYGIDSEIIINGDKHYLVRINVDNYLITSDATTYIPVYGMDVLSDLTNIKLGFRPLFFRLVNHKDEDEKNEFYSYLDSINTKFNLNNELYDRIKTNIKSIDFDLKDKILYFVDLINYSYSFCDGEVERRQIFECFYNMIFNDCDLKQINLLTYSNSYLLFKFIIEYNGEYYVEYSNGIKKYDADDLQNLSFKNLTHHRNY